MDLYEKIKELAALRQVSIRQIEENFGWGNGVINRWRTSKPSIEKVQAIAKYFNVDVDYLLGNNDIPKVEIEKPKVQILARQMDTKLTDDEIDMLGTLIEKFAKDRFGDK
ncbi:helix-turn-helix domain-containing protein [Lactococcus lactis]|uniref:helix-turn-helix domain-containing protein n=1 Tax=Lactococcus lactis TaxID=1358 RepID=UPI00288D50CE|nr:helix-turn-helix transcriptional regulator [Lactococcus lactis]MDT2860434.1 helix-turn-helix transcriptional regulator [Lactococcus lactis]